MSIHNDRSLQEEDDNRTTRERVKAMVWLTIIGTLAAVTGILLVRQLESLRYFLAVVFFLVGLFFLITSVQTLLATKSTTKLVVPTFTLPDAGAEETSGYMQE